MGCLNKKQILEANDLKTEKIFVPEWADGDPDAYVLLRTLTAADREAFENTIYSITTPEDGEKPKVTIDNKDHRAKLCAFCMVDDDGNRLFTEADIPDLAGKSASALERVFNAAQTLNGFGATALKEVVKN